MVAQSNRLQRPEEMLTLFEAEIELKRCRNVAITYQLLQRARLGFGREIQLLVYY